MWKHLNIELVLQQTHYVNTLIALYFIIYNGLELSILARIEFSSSYLHHKLARVGTSSSWPASCCCCCCSNSRFWLSAPEMFFCYSDFSLMSQILFIYNMYRMNKIWLIWIKSIKMIKINLLKNTYIYTCIYIYNIRIVI